MDEANALVAPQAADVAPDFDARCERFLDRAAEIRDAHVIAAVISLGRAALEEFFDGSWERAFDRSAAQGDSLGALVARHGARLEYLGLSLDQIRTALRAYQVDRQLPAKSKGKLLPGALRALSVVPDPSALVRLANEAVAEAWTVERTQAEVSAWRVGAGVKGKGGRPPLPAAVKAVRRVSRGAEGLADVDFAGLGVEELAVVRGELEGLRDRVLGLLGELAS